ncbi:MAG TPA: hypothetical protein VFQ60_03105 [Patescibacteria group bacterium]|nr:hypothetical protein [Patescibacteria group bacterium]
METMPQKQFWLSYFVALFSATVIASVIDPIAASWRRTPEYVTYLAARDAYDKEKEAYDQAAQRAEEVRKENVARIEQRSFEEVLAGVKPHTALRGSSLEGVAYAIRTLGRPDEPHPFPRAEAIHALLRDRLWLQSNTNSDDGLLPAVRVVNDTPRLARLLSGDRSAIQPDLPPELQKVEEKKPEPHFDLQEPTAHMPRSSAYLWTLYMIWAAVFSFGFFLSAWVFYRGEPKNSERAAHPFTGVPNTPLSWIFLFPFLPGFAAGYILYFLAQSPRPAILWLKARLFEAKYFEEELVQVRAEFMRLKEYFGKTDLIRRMECQLDRIAAERDGINLGEFRKVLSHMDSCRNHLTLIEELQSEV